MFVWAIIAVIFGAIGAIEFFSKVNYVTSRSFPFLLFIGTFIVYIIIIIVFGATFGLRGVVIASIIVGIIFLVIAKIIDSHYWM